MARHLQPSDLIADRYELEELVGSGGMSTVFRARDQQLGRRVAIKILHERYGDDPEYVERFRREARSVAQLSHPHIVTVIDRGEDGGQQFIVFEFVDGENLKQLVGRIGPLPVRRAIELALEILRIVGVVLVEDLDRDAPLELAVAGAEDTRHAAGSHELLELVAVGDQLTKLRRP